jgi:hypothetical protein
MLSEAFSDQMLSLSQKCWPPLICVDDKTRLSLLLELWQWILAFGKSSIHFGRKLS